MMKNGSTFKKRNLDLRKSFCNKDSQVLGWSGERLMKVWLESMLTTYLSKECLT